jgi:hypothetical protein
MGASGPQDNASRPPRCAQKKSRGDTHVAGLFCHLCPRSGPTFSLDSFFGIDRDDLPDVMHDMCGTRLEALRGHENVRGGFEVVAHRVRSTQALR